MIPPSIQNSLDEWLNILRGEIQTSAPELLDLFETYAGEAQFGREYIDSNLKELPIGARILEVGAGALILSSHLVKEGYIVTALEPIDRGFSHFFKLRQLVLEQAYKSGFTPDLLNISAENLNEKASYDFSFSINVMEHVTSVKLVIENVARAMKPTGVYRFTCPNYFFPYEPHFNIPTLFSKKLTEHFFKDRIFTYARALDPNGVWSSLNWITVRQVASIVQGCPLIDVSFRRDLFYVILLRIVNDPIFSARRSLWLRKLVGVMVSLGIHKLATFIPVTLQPVIDCTLVCNSKGQE
jgi:SAM-dependent methyltransferase